MGKLMAAGALLAMIAAPVAANAQTIDPWAGRTHVDWSRDAVIYQINTRQFTAEGTFAAAEAELPRLAEMGVDILWLMPIHPIGTVERKGSLGSPYSVLDYKGVNPEFGDLDDFKNFVDAAHAQGMKVILDWVANHTAWDHPWVEEHPEWYQRTDDGGLISPFGWTDIVVLDYTQQGVHDAMIDALSYWVREADVDGYRADVAGFLPKPFWTRASAELDAIKPVWMLAEYEDRDLHEQFDATYFWEWEKHLQKLGRGEETADTIWGLYEDQGVEWPSGAQRMIFTSTHDENAWAGPARERLGPALENAIALTFLAKGIPLIYNGQEAGLNKRLEFFERDPIVWQDHPHDTLFRDLIALRTQYTSLHNAPWGAPMTRVGNSDEERVFSFVRANEADAVMVLQNYSAEAVTVTLSDFAEAGTWIEHYDDTPEALRPAPVSMGEGKELGLSPWSTRIFSRLDR
ncbi:alpha-amylase family glycosyl hydrolase [Sphingomicrobium sp. XHP0239]|uniref:alpha-amylase family glycosyl hydrolase n=1 Tax=Sphingomicrobium maritimum TaxID=3133972 RepID=UPI0031CC9F33